MSEAQLSISKCAPCAIPSRGPLISAEARRRLKLDPHLGAGNFLHYANNTRKMEAGDLVVVDIGAEYEYYTADITRTWPVSGTFTPRQRQILTPCFAK